MQKEPLPLQHPFSLHLTITLLFLCHLLPGVRLCFLGNRAQKSLSALTMINTEKASQAAGAGFLAHAQGIQRTHHLSSHAGPGLGGAACANSHTKISVAFSYQLPEGVRCCREQSVHFSLIVPQWAEQGEGSILQIWLHCLTGFQQATAPIPFLSFLSGDVDWARLGRKGRKQAILYLPERCSEKH